MEQGDIRKLCGACHQWGCDPRIKDGKCLFCDRTEDQITQRHGLCFLSEDQKAEIKEFHHGAR